MEHRFLLADDSASARHMVRQILASREEWHICAEASDGDGAIEKALATSPELVIMDISMPRLNGIEAARRILEDCPHTPVLMISAFDPGPYLSYLFKIGICGFVRKDTVDTDLVPAIEALLRGQHYLRPTQHWLSLADCALGDRLAGPHRDLAGDPVAAVAPRLAR
ncbi:MAG TPA: response regulator transcription factor [Candidatus Acidoferrales bacterium]|nr:response regulator transcription factor [Candidatus Acidoferrales bacterium]